MNTAYIQNVLVGLAGITLTFIACLHLFTDVVRTPIASAETRIVEYSPSGMRLVPASCESSPFNYHLAPPPSGDGRGFSVPSNGLSYGAVLFGYTFCIQNTSGATYFVPANSASELVNFWTGPNHPYTTHSP